MKCQTNTPLAGSFDLCSRWTSESVSDRLTHADLCKTALMADVSTLYPQSERSITPGFTTHDSFSAGRGDHRPRQSIAFDNGLGIHGHPMVIRKPSSGRRPEPDKLRGECAPVRGDGKSGHSTGPRPISPAAITPNGATPSTSASHRRWVVTKLMDDINMMK